MGPKDLNSERKKRLKKHAVKFRDSVIPDELLPHLLCLTDSVKERISRKQNNDGAPDAAFKLSLDLPKYDDWFEQLIPALREIGLNNLAELLDDPKVDPQVDPEVDAQVEHHGARQNGNNRQTDKGKGAPFNPHHPKNQGASGYPTAQNEEQANVEIRQFAASSEVLKRQNGSKFESVTGATLYRRLPATVLEVLRLLDVPCNIAANDWKGLAGYLGYKIDAVERLKLEKSPTEALLMEWGTAENATLNTLMEALKAMRREDVYSQLQKVLGFHGEGFDQLPRPKSPPSCSATPQPLPSVGNLPKLDLAWDDDGEAKVAYQKPPGKRNDEPRDSSSTANRAGESAAEGNKHQENLNNGNKRNAGNSGSDVNNTGSSGQVEAKESSKDCPVTDQVGIGRCPEAPGATSCAGRPITNGGTSKSETRNKNDTLDRDMEPESKNATSEGGSIINNLNRHPHVMTQNITSDQTNSAPEPKLQNNHQYVEDNLRESDQQSTNMTMSNATKMVAGDTGEGDQNVASILQFSIDNLDRHGKKAHQSFSDTADENCTGKTLLSGISQASTTASSNYDMNMMHSITGPDDFIGSLKNPDSLDKDLELEMSAKSFPSTSREADDSKSLEMLADSQSAARNTPVSKSTQNTASKDMPSSSAAPMGLAMPSPSTTAALSVTPSASARSTLSATPSPSATPDLTASSTHQVISTPNTKGAESPHNAAHVQKSMKGTPVTQPAHVPADVPGGLRTPSGDATFSEDSLMIAISPGRMLRQSQTKTTQEAAGKLQQSSFDAKQAASGTQHNPHNTKHNLPSHNMSANSPPASPTHEDDVRSNEKQSMSEDDPCQELQENILERPENAAPVPPEIDEPQGRSFLGSVLRAGPVLFSIASAFQSGDFAPYNN